MYKAKSNCIKDSVYIDDGYSGTSFERPGFQRMMDDIQAGVVDCVAVKDLSRFGRDYIEAGRLIQKIFPALNVRFIAVTDHFDSLVPLPCMVIGRMRGTGTGWCRMGMQRGL